MSCDLLSEADQERIDLGEKGEQQYHRLSRYRSLTYTSVTDARFFSVETPTRAGKPRVSETGLATQPPGKALVAGAGIRYEIFGKHVRGVCAIEDVGRVEGDRVIGFSIIGRRNENYVD